MTNVLLLFILLTLLGVPWVEAIGSALCLAAVLFAVAVVALFLTAMQSWWLVPTVAVGLGIAYLATPRQRRIQVSVPVPSLPWEVARDARQDAQRRADAAVAIWRQRPGIGT